MMSTSQLERPTGENGASGLDARVRSLRLNNQPAANSRTTLLPWALCGILLLTTTAFGYRAYRVGTLTPSSTQESTTPPTSSTTTTSSTPAASAGEVVVRARGYVVPAHQVQVSPKVGGMILSLNDRFEEGHFFSKGDVLAKLETDDYEADLKHAEAARDAAEQRYKESLCNRDEEIEAARNELKE